MKFKNVMLGLGLCCLGNPLLFAQSGQVFQKLSSLPPSGINIVNYEMDATSPIYKGCPDDSSVLIQLSQDKKSIVFYGSEFMTADLGSQLKACSLKFNMVFPTGYAFGIDGISGDFYYFVSPGTMVQRNMKVSLIGNTGVTTAFENNLKIANVNAQSNNCILNDRDSIACKGYLENFGTKPQNNSIIKTQCGERNSNGIVSFIYQAKPTSGIAIPGNLSFISNTDPYDVRTSSFKAVLPISWYICHN